MSKEIKIEKYLERLLDLLLMENYEIIVEDNPEVLILKIALSEEDSGILIGYHGETITALQRFLRTVYGQSLGEKRLVVNINDYRDSREEKIQAMIEKGVKKIEQYGGDYKLYRLSSPERFFAHNLISSEERFSHLTSFSQDSAEGRVLIIQKKIDADA